MNLIGSTVLLLLRHPGERKRLQDDLSLLPSAVEECLRFEPPCSSRTERWVGTTASSGRSAEAARVIVVMAAATRESARCILSSSSGLSTSAARSAYASAIAPGRTAALSSLQRLGIAREITGKRRNRVYAYDRYVAMLDEATQVR